MVQLSFHRFLGFDFLRNIGNFVTSSERTMALHTLVKISRVNNLSDARYCAGMGVSLLGVNVEQGTPHFLDPQTFQEIAGWVAGPDYVAEFASESNPETIIQVAEQYPVQFIQFNNPALAEALQDKGYRLIYQHVVQENESPEGVAEILDKVKGLVDYILLEHKQEDAAVSDAWLDMAKNYSLILGFGITADNALTLAQNDKLAGIALYGEEEIRVGYKDFEMADVLEAIEKDD